MVDKYTRDKLYDYQTVKEIFLNSQNANLVVSRPRETPRENEPSGEAETLGGKQLKRFGDLAVREKRERKPEKKPRPSGKNIIKDKTPTGTVLDLELSEPLLYKPKTKETQLIYEELLSFMHHYLPDQPHSILASALDVVLATLKLEDMNDKQKHLEIEAIIGKISNSEFNRLYTMSKGLVDYGEPEEQDTGEMIVEVPVEFDINEHEDKGEEESDVEQSITDEEGEKIHEETGANVAQKTELNLDELVQNPFWLQNQLKVNLKLDDMEAYRIERELIPILKAKDCENKLVLLLKTDNFDFIKTLLKNRFAIHYLTRLSRSQNSEEKDNMIHEMSETSEGIALLKQISDLNIIESGVKELKEPQRILTQVDLEALKFAQGALFMSNKKVVLPKGSYRKTQAGYEEVVIPPVENKANTQIKEIPITSLPKWMQPAFVTDTLNKVQSTVLPTAFDSDENLLVCAPTSSGKTNIALLTILRVLSNHTNEGLIDLKKVKIVYIAPMKALVRETVGNLTQRLKSFGIVVKELSGDINMTKKEIEETHIIVSTPEKWDIITRKVGGFAASLKLIILDEIHLLHDTRGAVLECIVARMLRKNDPARIVALSATLPNYKDVASFLNVNPSIGLFFFDASFRPIPLEQRFIGITEKKGVKKMLLVNEVTYEKVSERVGNKQVIIFVHSRRDTLKTANSIKELAIAKEEVGKFVLSETRLMEFREIMSEDKAKIRTNQLLEYGIGVHHAGMSRDEREIIEEYFNNGYIQVMVSTATLAWGVNLPAHTVIIKGTEVYDPEKGGWTELSHLDVMQMMGRAGRYGYGSNIGEGIIITAHTSLHYYLSLLNQQLPIESQLIASLPDALNAEIILGSISNINDAVNWLEYTYFYTRLKKSPETYGLGEVDFYSTCLNLVHSAVTLLDRHGLVRYDRKTKTLQMTQLGRVASHYYIKYQSMGVYNENLKPSLGIIDLFRLFSLSNEFKQLKIRPEEKKEVEKLMTKVPIPIKGSMEEVASKINILLQAYISQLPLEGYALASDMVYVSQSAGRIFRALFEISVKRGWANVSLTLLNICKMIDRRMWGSMSPLRQFNVIPEEILYKIESKQQLTWDRFYDLTVQQISDLIRVNKKNAEGIYKLVQAFPKVELQANIQPLTRSCILVDLIITPSFNQRETFHVFVEDNDSEVILHYETWVLKEKHANEDARLTFIVPMIEPMPPQYFIRVVSDKWINCEKLLAISFRHTLLPEKFPPHTGLMDLKPITFPPFGSLNAIQTQTFKAVYETNDSILVGAATGSGKTLIAEIAMHKYLNETSENLMKTIVYLTPQEGLMKEKFKEFQSKFGRRYKISCLTGQVTLDNYNFDNSHIVLTTKEHLDMLTRKWRKKPSLQDLGLVIIDEIHLLGESGSVLEVVLSRLRYISSKTRLICLGTSLANPNSIAEWLGIKPTNIFNFNPNVRTNKLEVFIHGFDQYSRKLRLNAMNPHLQLVIKDRSVIYVSDIKQAKHTAYELIGLKKKQKDLEEEISRFLISDKSLVHCLVNGIGYLYDGIKEYDKEIVLQLYESKAIDILIITQDLAWEMNIMTECTIILDPVKKKDHVYVDYSIPDMLQMIGRANIPIKGRETCKCILFCQNSKREFYKKFLLESFPVESHLNHFLHDHLNAEIVCGTIQSRQDCVDWLTWTFMYRRLLLNPNYYDMKGKSNVILNDYLSDLVENTLIDLKGSKCIDENEAGEIIPLNLGKIASFYYVKYNTIDLFFQSLGENSKLKDMLKVLTSAYEFEEISLDKTPNEALEDYFSRLIEMKSKNLSSLVIHASRLILAMVDVLASNQLLKQSILAMEISQMIVQGMWITQSPLLQLPYFDSALVAKCAEYNVQDFPDLMNMEDKERNDLLNMNEERMSEIAQVCNRYPSIDMKIDTQVQGSHLTVNVTLQRDWEESILTPVTSMTYPVEKEESWWIVIGVPRLNKLLAIKRITFVKDFKIPLKVDLPEMEGDHSYVVYLICDSYIGCDQDEKINFSI